MDKMNFCVTYLTLNILLHTEMSNYRGKMASRHSFSVIFIDALLKMLKKKKELSFSDNTKEKTKNLYFFPPTFQHHLPMWPPSGMQQQPDLRGKCNYLYV